MSEELKNLSEGINRSLEELKTAVDQKAQKSSAELEEKIGKIISDVEAKALAAEAKAEAAEKQAKLIEELALSQKAGEPAANEAEIKAFEDILRVNRKSHSGWDAEKNAAYSSAFKSAMQKGFDPSRVSTLDGAELKALQEGVDADGGYLVPADYQAKIISQVFETSPMRGLANVMNTGRDTVQIPVDFSDITSAATQELATQANTTSPTFDMLEIRVHNQTAKVPASLEMLEDSIFNMDSYMQSRIADKFARQENTWFVTGDGLGKPRGFLSYANGTGYGQVEQTNTATAGATVWADMMTLLGKLKTGYHSRAAFAMNRVTWFNLLKEQATTGSFKISYGVEGQSVLGSAKPGFNFLGYPVVLFEDMTGIATSGATAGIVGVALADWNQAYQIVDRVGISVLRDPYSVDGAVVFKARKRVGGGVSNSEAIKLLTVA